MSTIPSQHKAYSPTVIRCAVITVSDSRTPETDKGGDAVAEHLVEAGHEVLHRQITRDDPDTMRTILATLCARADIDAVMLTGGTGLSSRDFTYETVESQLTKQRPGYGELFRMLSYQEIGAAAMLSRAIGGLIGTTVVLTMPGSPAGVRLAMSQVIVPELSHLVGQARR